MANGMTSTSSPGAGSRALWTAGTVRLDQLCDCNMGEVDLHDNQQDWIKAFELISQVVQRWTTGPEKWKSSWRQPSWGVFPQPGAGSSFHPRR
ncbi:hypothetical protein AGR1A_Cc50509 [Agrobacterium fabacearum CFBP 5771]|nr:hypothetical protein AGR1A_Cc50509 [Agrobacterium fabacearum CFBP 5771]